MAYTAWSVVYGEQPTAAKWNQLGANDAGFKDGTNIDDDAIVARHIADASVDDARWRNNIAFSAYRSTDQTVTGSTDALIICADERYDYGSAYDTSNGRFVAPYNGIYHFDGQVSAVSATRIRPILSVNGSSLHLGSDFGATVSNTAQISNDIKLNAGQYVELRGYITGSTTIYGSASMATAFQGHLVTRL